QNSQYMVRGRVVGSAQVRPEKSVNRPYTYWHVQVEEQFQGEALPSNLEVREPGGEIGELGYHVAGTAEFSDGEDTFIALHDTPEAGVKEVVGLASGKYTVAPGKNGKPVVMSGLGNPIFGTDGEPLSPEDFSSLLHRISRGQATAADKNIFVTRTMSHGKDDDASALEKVAKQTLKHPLPEARPPSAAVSASSTGTAISPALNTPTNAPNAVQQSGAGTEETSTGSSSWGWVIALGVLVGLVAGLYFTLR
ncbi:MAG: hypothetical protein ACXVB9_15590, partial [Bdellovibrionota bacterium]